MRSLRLHYHAALLSFWNRIATYAERSADRHYAARSRLICATVRIRPSKLSR